MKTLVQCDCQKSFCLSALCINWNNRRENVTYLCVCINHQMNFDQQSRDPFRRAIDIGCSGKTLQPLLVVVIKCLGWLKQFTVAFIISNVICEIRKPYYFNIPLLIGYRLSSSSSFIIWLNRWFQFVPNIRRFLGLMIRLMRGEPFFFLFYAFAPQLLWIWSNFSSFIPWLFSVASSQIVT